MLYTYETGRKSFSVPDNIFKNSTKSNQGPPTGETLPNFNLGSQENMLESTGNHRIKQIHPPECQSLLMKKP